MENYTITGGDGKEYGPVPATTIREWVQQGRANTQTIIRRGEESPRPLGELPEFSDLFENKKNSPARSSGPVRLGTPMAPATATSAPLPEPSGFPASGTSTGTGNDQVVVALSEPLAGAGFWLKLMAILQIVSGAFSVLTIVGILWAWLPIWMGVLMWQAANRAREASMSGDFDLALSAQNKIKLLIVIMGVLTLLYLVAIIGFFIFTMIVGASAPGFMDQLQQLQQGRY